MPPIKEGFDAVVDSHEDRLQRVESTVTDTAVRVAEIGVKQDYLTGTVKDGLVRIEASLERLVGRVADHGARLEPLEASVKLHDRRHKNRVAFLKKSAVAALLAAGGVFATKGGEWLWILLSK